MKKKKNKQKTKKKTKKQHSSERGIEHKIIQVINYLVLKLIVLDLDKLNPAKGLPKSLKGRLCCCFRTGFHKT